MIWARCGKRKNYYVNESVGIASGFLLTALAQCGLGNPDSHTKPHGLFGKDSETAENEKAVLLIPVGYPAENAKVPDLKKKSFQEVATII